jgi:hypothetical protein
MLCLSPAIVDVKKDAAALYLALWHHFSNADASLIYPSTPQITSAVAPFNQLRGVPRPGIPIGQARWHLLANYGVASLAFVAVAVDCG